MCSVVGEENIPELVKSLESAFHPDHFKTVADKLLAREENWRRKYEAMKTKEEARTTSGNVLKRRTDSLRNDERTQLKGQIVRLTQEKDNLKIENSDWKRAYEELERKISQIEKIAMEMKDNRSGNSARKGDSDLPSKPPSSHLIFDDYVYATPRRVPNPGPAPAQADGNGNGLEIVDCDDDLALIGDTAARKTCQMKVAERNSTRTNGEKNRKRLKQDGTPVINLCDDENESRGRKSRKLRACSGFSETDWSSSKSRLDIVVLNECQEPALSDTTKKRSSPMPEVPIRRWNSDNDMLADFTDDDELCMRAVCALYRHQKKKRKFIEDLQFSEGSLFG